MSANRILVGVVGKPHGVRGLVHVHAYTADPASLASYTLRDERGRAWRLAWRQAGVAEVTDAEGRALADRNAAERLANARLYVDREALPEAGEEEYYLADLIGLAAHDAAGALLGTISAVHDYGAGASLDIAGATGSLLIPFTRAAVPAVDIAAGSLTVHPPQEMVWEAAGAAPEGRAA